MSNANMNTELTIKVGALVEALDVIGCSGCFRVIEGHRAPQPGKVWIRETGLRVVGQPFVIEWPIEKIRVVEA